MLHNPLFKTDSKGLIRVWRIEQEGEQYRTVSGPIAGTMTSTGWTTCTPKNVGRASETTAEQQADLEVQAEYEKKLKRGYTRTVEELDQVTIFKPMLAKEWSGELGYMQPKLDGMRCIARADGLWSRTGQPIVAVPHIFEALKPFFEIYPELTLDGELYNHNFRDDFPKLMSLCRKTKPTAEDLEESKVIEYHVYDIPSHPKDFSVRFARLKKMSLPHPVVTVDTEWAHNLPRVEELYAFYLEIGYEGAIIRKDAPYENKRSGNLLKRKDFKDSEFEIVRIEEGNGNWAGYAKTVTVRLSDGREFGAGIAGNQSALKRLLEEKDLYVGKKVTIRYFTESPDGIPRFPVAKAFHKEDRW